MNTPNSLKWCHYSILTALFAGGCVTDISGTPDGEGADMGPGREAPSDSPPNPEPGPPPTPDSPDPIPETDAALLTQNNSQNIESGNSVGCLNTDAAGAQTSTAANSFYRVYGLRSGSPTAENFAIGAIQFGVERLTSPGLSYPIEVRLYTLAGSFTLENLRPLTAVVVELDSQSSGIVGVPVSSVVPANSTLVVEIYAPDGQADGQHFFIGSNTLGETAPGYLRAESCGVVQPTRISDVNPSSQMHMVINVTGIYL